MPRIHALSDIHGHAAQFEKMIRGIDLDTHSDDRLILLGDYIDRGPDSAKCLYLAKELSDRFPERVVALLGNHEADFLEWLDMGSEAVDWLHADQGLGTIRSFLNPDALLTLGEELSSSRDFDDAVAANGRIQSMIRAEHRELLTWLRKRPLYYESPEQIYVHAGVDEEAGEDWKIITPDHQFTHKFPAQFGPFYKTIICGHTGTGGMHKNGSHVPYFDGQAHWYIDGSVEKTGKLNVLTYDTDTGEYSHFNGPARNYVLTDLGLVVPEAYTVHLNGKELGYMRERRGYARVEFKGTTIWEHGTVGVESEGYFRTVDLELTATPLLHTALRVLDEAYCREHPEASTHDLYPVDYEFVPYDWSQEEVPSSEA